ncbi:transmembrane sensor/regulator PpyR [Pseudomonas sp. SZMC_28357]|uniref:transmembrane sensor/regulator PpyR n=1 Tax=Pseudomonas sp. SZMC_28357 TaxID=3074380 RepID=UPI00287204C8|nr:transmembrane sensor/regulator PpyR [Pseudomonas sp. SZMC_28357]MDR9754237.1 transmembrane sensor/regulator PpyR [Pseudomonas sp. SZMC_28357]
MFNFFNNPLTVLHLSSKVLEVGLAMLLLGIYGAYFYQGHLALSVQVLMHAMTIVGPTLLKIGYVMRLLSQHRLSKKTVAVVA